MSVLDPDAVFLNAAAERRLGGTATTLVLQTAAGRRTLRIAGTVAAGGPPLVVVDIAGAQVALGNVGKLSRIDVRLAPGADRAATLAALQLPAGVRAAAPSEASDRISNVSRAYRVNLTVLALVAMFTGAFLVFSILALSVAQRAQQLALLAVLGLTARQRLGLVLAESALLGAVGSALGLALGAALAAIALRLFGGDLGGGYFPGVAPALRLDAAGAARLRLPRHRRRARRRLAAGAIGAAHRTGASAEGPRHDRDRARAGVSSASSCSRSARCSRPCRRCSRFRSPPTARSRCC